MAVYRDLQVHLLHKFPPEAISRPFAEFQPATREFGVITAPDIFVCDKYLFPIVNKQAVRPENE